MKIKLLTLLLAFALCLGLFSCSTKEADKSVPCNKPQSAALALSEDYGEEYIDSFIFFGESTTYHLKSRGVLRDGVSTKQVWAPECGTVNLDFTTKNIRIIYPETNTAMTVSDAAALSKPKYILFSFGLNGAVQKINRGKEYYKRSYLLLIDSVRAASPETKIILQSAFPVSSNMDTTRYSVSAATLNSYIDTINLWTLELASEEGLKYLNTAEVLKNESGALKKIYDVGDGHHLTKEAYIKILDYIRTHGYK